MLRHHLHTDVIRQGTVDGVLLDLGVSSMQVCYMPISCFLSVEKDQPQDAVCKCVCEVILYLPAPFWSSLLRLFAETGMVIA